VLAHFLQAVVYQAHQDGWRMPFDATRMRGYSGQRLVDADSGKVVVEPAKKLTAAPGAPAREKRASRPARQRRGVDRQYIARDLVNPKTGEIYVEP